VDAVKNAAVGVAHLIALRRNEDVFAATRHLAYRETGSAGD
jgi:hypothetical protein